MDENEFDFDQMAADLEKSIKTEEAVEQIDINSLKPEQLAKAVKLGLEVMQKGGKNGPTSDLSAEAGKSSEGLTSTEADPAQKPVKSGNGYPSVGKYTKTAKADEMDDEDEDETPSFFKKKSKGKKGKKVAKAEESEEENEEEVVDVSEFVEGMENAVDHIVKSMDRLEEGLATFGELVVGLADPRRDKLLMTIAKGINHIVTEQNDLKKSIGAQGTLVKSIVTTPAAPKIAGMSNDTLQKSEPNQGAEGDILSKSEQNRLFALATGKKIDMDEYKLAKSDVSEGRKILKRFE